MTDTGWRDRATMHATRAAWLEARTGTVGGSDVPVILGLSPFSTRLALWSRKVGLTPGPDESYAMRRGHHMESFIASELERDCPTVRVWEVLDNVTVQHAEHADLTYSPDGIGKEGEVEGLLEFKSRSPYGRKDWEESVPADVNAQVQHGMEVLDLPWALVAVDLGAEFRWARIERDPDWRERLPDLLEFARRVREEDAPDPSSDEMDAKILAGIYGETTGEIKPLDPDMLDVHEKLVGVTAEIKRLKKVEAGLKNQIRAAIGDADYGQLPANAGAYRWSWQSRAGHVVKPSKSRVLRHVKKV